MPEIMTFHFIERHEPLVCQRVIRTTAADLDTHLASGRINRSNTSTFVDSFISAIHLMVCLILPLQTTN